MYAYIIYIYINIYIYVYIYVTPGPGNSLKTACQSPRYVGLLLLQGVDGLTLGFDLPLDAAIFLAAKADGLTGR